MVAESVAAKIFKIGSVVFEIRSFYHITLWSVIVSITKNEHDEATYTKVWNAETALSHYCFAWTFVVTCWVKCLTFRSRSEVKLTLTFGIIKKVTLTSNDPLNFWGHKLGQTDHKGHPDLWGHKVGPATSNDPMTFWGHK